MSGKVLSSSGLALYERLVTAAGLPVGDGALGLTDPLLGELIDNGFAELTPDRTSLLPVAPVAAFERLLADLQTEFLDQQKQLLDAYSYLDGLQQRFVERQPASDVDALADVRSEAGAFDQTAKQIISEAASEVLCWNIALQQLGGPVAGPVAPRALRVRTVYDTAFLHRQGGVVALRRARSAGEELRIADEVTTNLVIVDASVVVLPLGTAPKGALLIRSPLVVEAMRQFFDLVWQRSVPWIDRESADEGLAPIQRQIVALMAVGHSDDAVAEHLGLSVRTVRRQVAEVMERLGADTRFAAGIAAARAGFLDDAELPPIMP
ncbi:MAG: hypothetical protein ACRDV3_17200 [Acidothermaceae bacterium]